MKKTINIVTLGCSKNLVDSERIMIQCEKAGYKVLVDSNIATEVVLINTCGFILDAKEESIATIMQYVAAKKHDKIEKVYVMGCLSARYVDELSAEIPEVDRFFGKFDFDAVLHELNVQKRKDLLFDRKITTPSHYAYLKIAEGCDRTCAFCAIPQFTGKHTSVPIDDLVAEAKILAQKGVKELLLISQELTYYGIDIYKTRKLPELIRKLSAVEGIEWIRLHYAYPAAFPLELLDEINNNPKVCKYLDLPLQHISTSVLNNMRRNINEEQIRKLVSVIRQRVPNIALRTTFVVGHPGETEHDFEKLMSFIQEIKFDRLGVFTYSHEEDTPGYKNLSDDISQEIKDERAAELMDVQQTISEEIASEKIGTTLKVLIDRYENDYFVGRTEFDSPEVDGEVFIHDKNLIVGEFYMVDITGSDMFDLYGEVHKKV